MLAALECPFSGSRRDDRIDQLLIMLFENKIKCTLPCLTPGNYGLSFLVLYCRWADLRPSKHFIASFSWRSMT